ESLEADLQNQATSLMLCLHRNLLTIAYHQVVVLHWRMVGRDLIGAPKGWRRKTYTAPGPVTARDITIRLVFEFVRQFGEANASGPPPYHGRPCRTSAPCLREASGFQVEDCLVF